MNRIEHRGGRPESVVTVAVWDDENEFNEESLKELNALVEVAGGNVVAEMTQNVRSYHPSTLMGKGKLEELKDFVRAEDVDLVVFDQELSGVQMREIEKILETDVLDRTAVVLDIFAARAKTDVGKLQVYLAQLEYGKNHLIGKRNYSRLGGGIGTRGPGEQKLEIDRRRIRADITRTKKRLARAKKIRNTGRKDRLSSKIPSIALVGYTNAGKSSIMNRLLKDGASSGKPVFVEDMPFASLDPDTRRIRLKDGLSVFVTDTVGFISNLPTALIESFYKTLEELKDADLIVHVIDGSGENAEMQYKTTRKILRDLEVSATPSILFVNKRDKMEAGRLPFLPAEDTVLYGSVKFDADFDYFFDALQEKIEGGFAKVDLHFGFDEMHRVEEIKARFPVEQFDYDHEGVAITTTLPKSYLPRYERQIRRRYV